MQFSKVLDTLSFMAVIVPNAIARPMAAVTDNRNHNGPEVPRVDIKTPGNLARSNTDAKYNNGKIYNLKKKRWRENKPIKQRL